jgi:hypothetical protein
MGKVTTKPKRKPLIAQADTRRIRITVDVEVEASDFNRTQFNNTVLGALTRIYE